jgi:prepilin-type N-terminal cleavage/methylation domain-containing protein
MKNQAFTLIETIVSLVIISLAALGLTASVREALYNSLRPRAYVTATALAESKAEELIRSDFSSLSNSSSNFTAFDGVFSDYSYRIIVRSPGTAWPGWGPYGNTSLYKAVDVIVYHRTVNNLTLSFLKAADSY